MKKRTLSWEMQGQTLHLHSFSFPPSFPDGRGFGSARTGTTHGEHTGNAWRAKYADRSWAETAPGRDSGSQVQILLSAPKAVDTTVGQWHSAALKVCWFLLWWMLCMLAGHIAHGENKLGEAKAGYRRANDKGQWWEAGASSKKGSEQKWQR